MVAQFFSSIFLCRKLHFLKFDQNSKVIFYPQTGHFARDYIIRQRSTRLV